MTMMHGGCYADLCLKNLNQLASIGLVEMDEDCYLLKPTGLHGHLHYRRLVVACRCTEY